MSPAATTTPIKALIIYAMPGSQFVFKVLAALQSRKILHYVEFVPLEEAKRRKVMPSGNSQVPEMLVKLKKVNDDGNEEDEEEGEGDHIIVPDSEKILHWIDDNYDWSTLDSNVKFFPTEQASEISIRASDGLLAKMVWYYNWVNYKGYSNSFQKIVRSSLPFQYMWPNFVIDRLMSSTMVEFKEKVKNYVKETNLARSVKEKSNSDGDAQNVDADNDDDDDAAAIALIEDDEKMEQLLIDELEFFQSLLEKSEEASKQGGNNDDDDDDGSRAYYMIPGIDEPTAADFSIYAQLERLVGGTTASDVDIISAMQRIKDEEPTKSSLSKLWTWHDHMRANYHVQFKHKRYKKNNKKKDTDGKDEKNHEDEDKAKSKL